MSDVSSPFDAVALLVPAELYRLLSVQRNLLSKTRAQQREADELVPVAKARATHLLILSYGGDEKALGPNAEARERAILIHLDGNFGYQEIVGAAHQARRAVDAVEANIADLESALKLRAIERADEERASRDRYTDALVRYSDTLVRVEIGRGVA